MVVFIWGLETDVSVDGFPFSSYMDGILFFYCPRCAPGDPLLGIGNADNKSVIKSPGLATDSHLKQSYRLIFCVVQTTNICEI